MNYEKLISDAVDKFQTTNGLVENMPPLNTISKIDVEMSTADPRIPGEFAMDESGKLLRKYLLQNNVGSDLVAGFNHLVLYTLPKIISMYTMDNTNQIRAGLAENPPINIRAWKLFFRNIQSYTPRILENGSSVLLYPSVAERRNLTYAFTITAEVVVQYDNDETTEKSKFITIVRMPAMIGSVMCNLYGKNREDFGELNTDPVGYLIIKGRRKITILQQKLQINRPFIYFKDASEAAICRMTCSTIHGTCLVSITRDKDDMIVLLRRKYSGKKDPKEMAHVPFYVPMLICGWSEHKIIEYLKAFIAPERWNKVAEILIPTMATLNLNWFLDNTIDRMGIVETYQGTPEAIYMAKLNNVKEKIFENLFPQFDVLPPERKYEEKNKMLLLMVTKYSQFLAGLIPLDNRDDWANKKIDPLSSLFHQKIVDSWPKIMIKIAGDLVSIENEDHLNQFDGKYQTARRQLNIDFINSFESNVWSVFGEDKQNVIVELNVESWISPFSHIHMIGSDASDRTDSLPRLPKGNQIGFIDLVKTPETSRCGLTEYLGLTASVTIDVPDEPIIRRLTEQGFIYGKSVVGKTDLCVINGIILGWCNGTDTRKYLITLRRSGKMHMHTSVVYNVEKTLIILTTGGRLVRPLLIVNPVSRKPLFREAMENKLINPFDNSWSFSDWLREGWVEYLDPYEQAEQPGILIAKRLNYLDSEINEMNNLANDIKDMEYKLNQVINDKDSYTSISNNLKIMKMKWEELTITTQYTHVEINPQALLGVSSSTIIMANHNALPRNTYQSSMINQALSVNRAERLDGTGAKALANPTVPITQAETQDTFGRGRFAYGSNLIMAVMAYKQNMEDAVIMSKKYIEMTGKMFIRKVFRATIEQNNERFMRPPNKENDPKYKAIDERGYPILFSRVEENDYIIGKIIEVPTGGYENASVKVTVGIKGIIDVVQISPNIEGKITIKVAVTEFRQPTYGDKFALTPAQKTTVGMIPGSTIYPDEDMPYLKARAITRFIDGKPYTGMMIHPVDIIYSPHAFPSRMTVGTQIEMILSQAGILTGQLMNGTAFNNIDIQSAEDILMQYGFDPCGYQTMISGKTGREIKAKIFMGPVHAETLRHQTQEKFQATGNAPRNPITNEPVGGKSRGGSGRLGEMEQAGIGAHGASALLRERLCYTNPDILVLCKSCGQTVITRVESTDTRAPDVSFTCKNCNIRGSENMERCTIKKTLRVLWTDLSIMNIKVTYNTTGKQNRM